MSHSVFILVVVDLVILRHNKEIKNAIIAALKGIMEQI